MQQSTTAYFKVFLIIIGFILLGISSQMVFSNLFIDDWDSFGTDHIVHFIAYNHYHWYVIVVSSLLIFGTGYFFNRKANKIITWILTILSFIVVLFFTYSPLNFYGLVFKSGYYVSILGEFCIVLGTLISVMRKEKKHSSEQLLDH